MTELKIKNYFPSGLGRPLHHCLLLVNAGDMIPMSFRRPGISLQKPLRFSVLAFLKFHRDNSDNGSSLPFWATDTFNMKTVPPSGSWKSSSTFLIFSFLQFFLFSLATNSGKSWVSGLNLHVSGFLHTHTHTHTYIQPVFWLYVERFSWLYLLIYLWYIF